MAHPRHGGGGSVRIVHVTRRQRRILVGPQMRCWGADASASTFLCGIISFITTARGNGEVASIRKTRGQLGFICFICLFILAALWLRNPSVGNNFWQRHRSPSGSEGLAPLCLCPLTSPKAAVLFLQSSHFLKPHFCQRNWKTCISQWLKAIRTLPLAVCVYQPVTCMLHVLRLNICFEDKW